MLWAGLVSGTGGEPPMANSEAAGERIISGVVIKGGVECPLFQTDGGEKFTLMGVGGSGRFEPGARLRITGRPAAVSTCMQGKSLIVEAAEVLED